MRKVFADFARLQERPDLGLSVLLGREDRNSELAGLIEGERMLLVEPGDLYAVGAAACIESGGYRYWYGVLESMDAIREGEPTTAARQATSS